ncbi:MAG: hypothetical protein GY928_05890 [Colwellia sp.]|nr:hypothetical protein [Colwellia sp.]
MIVTIVQIIAFSQAIRQEKHLHELDFDQVSLDKISSQYQNPMTNYCVV